MFGYIVRAQTNAFVIIWTLHSNTSVNCLERASFTVVRSQTPEKFICTVYLTLFFWITHICHFKRYGFEKYNSVISKDMDLKFGKLM